MKKLLLSTLCALISIASYSQTYTQLGTDASGDVISNPPAALAPDLKAVSYAIDAVKDSIWFKVEYYTTINAATSYGLLIGLDTNQKTSDGSPWPGTNKSMKCDLLFHITKQAGATGGFATLDPSSPFITGISIKFDIANANTVIIGTKLSSLDKNGKFNLVVSSSNDYLGFTGVVYDDAPESGYWSIGGAPTGCSAPANIAVSNIKDTSVTVTWPAVTGATEYEVAVTTSSTPPASGKSGNVLSAAITGLKSKTSYYAHVRTKCSATTFSSWLSKSFSTATTGVNDVDNLHNLIVYPNPAKNNIVIEGLTNGDELRLINLLGTTIFSDVSVNTQKQIDISNLPTGLYFLDIKGKTHSKTMRIEKL